MSETATERNREKRRAYMHAYYVAHSKTIKERAWNWQKNNPDKVRVSQRKWAQTHPEAVSAKYKRWMDKNLPYFAAKQRKRRERVRSVEQCDAASSTVLAQLISSCARMKCGICGKNMPKNDRTIDHVIPLAKGGTGHIGNLQVVHLSCNCAKRAKMPHELDGQHQINFAGNRAHLNTSDGESRQALASNRNCRSNDRKKF